MNLIDKFKQEEKEFELKKDGTSFLNNFFTRLPIIGLGNRGGIRRSQFDDSDWTNKNSEIFNKSRGYSDLFLSKTPQEFYADVDQAVLDSGLEFEDFSDIWNAGKRDYLNEFSKEVYMRLREMGYNRYPDLVL